MLCYDFCGLKKSRHFIFLLRKDVCTNLRGVWECFVSPSVVKRSGCIEFTYSCFFQHANGENPMIGIDGNTGEITDMKERGVSHVTLGLTCLN